MQFSSNDIFIYGKIGIEKDDEPNRVSLEESEIISSHSIMKSIIDKIESGADEINIYINSLTAEIEDILELLAFIGLVDIPINVYCLGSIASYSSWLLFLASGKRYVARTALIKTCDFIDSSGYMGQSEFESYCSVRKIVRDSILERISNRSKLSVEDIEAFLFTPRIKSLSTEELLNHGLIDEIL